MCFNKSSRTLGREPINLPGVRLTRVRYAPIADQIPRRSDLTLRAMCGRLQVGKENLHVAGLVGAAMCSAFECGSHDRWP
jgi:hypothetical protein